jgi:predicted nucleic acid-binding protein
VDRRGTALSANFVVDASVGFAWVYPGQATPETDQWLNEVAAGASVIVPALWYLEMSNVLLIAQRRHRLTAVQRKAAMEKLTAMQFTLDEEGTRHAFSKTSELAEKHGLTIYDATYLELAMRRSLPLATRDAALKTAAKRCGVKAP